MAGDAAEDSGKKDEKSGNQEDDEAGAGLTRKELVDAIMSVANA